MIFGSLRPLSFMSQSMAGAFSLTENNFFWWIGERFQTGTENLAKGLAPFPGRFRIFAIETTSNLLTAASTNTVNMRVEAVDVNLQLVLVSGAGTGTFSVTDNNPLDDFALLNLLNTHWLSDSVGSMNIRGICVGVSIFA